MYVRVWFVSWHIFFGLTLDENSGVIEYEPSLYRILICIVILVLALLYFIFVCIHYRCHNIHIWLLYIALLMAFITWFEFFETWFHRLELTVDDSFMTSICDSKTLPTYHFPNIWQTMTSHNFITHVDDTIGKFCHSCLVFVLRSLQMEINSFTFILCYQYDEKYLNIFIRLFTQTVFERISAHPIMIKITSWSGEREVIICTP